MISESGTSWFNYEIDTSPVDNAGKGLSVLLTGGGSLKGQDLEKIGQEGVKMAKAFLKSNGNHHPGSYRSYGGVDINGYYGTGRLHESVQYQVEDCSVSLSAPAKDPKGRSYAAYVEYGFSAGGRFLGPWPFLRPALQLMVEASHDGITKALQNMVSQAIAGGSILSSGKTTGVVNIGTKSLANNRGERSNLLNASRIRGGWGGAGHADKGWSALKDSG